LASGVLVVEAAAGPQSFLAHEENLLHAVDMPDAQSPFRSRDVFPDALAALMRGQADLVVDRVSLSILRRFDTRLRSWLKS
jgi:hypothetical protein